MVERVHKLMGTKRRVRRPRGPSPLAGSSAATAITKRPRNPSPPSVDRSWKSQISTCVAEPLSQLSGFADLLSTPVTPEPRRWVRAVPLTGIVVESRGPASGCPLAGPAQAECVGPQTSAPCPGGTQAQGQWSDLCALLPHLVLPRGLGCDAWLLHTMPELHVLI